MSSRDKILAAVANNQPPKADLPDISSFNKNPVNVNEQFEQILSGIGGKVIYVDSWEAITAAITEKYEASARIVSPIPELTGFPDIPIDSTAHQLYDVELAIIKAHFGVAENGAVWVTENFMGLRVLPFICQHLAVVLDQAEIVPTMYEAYEKMSKLPSSGFGSFIAGPSKTADIEQSLVIGAHGPKSMTVFIKK